jgi:hypothetical protein
MIRRIFMMCGCLALVGWNDSPPASDPCPVWADVAREPAAAGRQPPHNPS